MYNVYPCIYNMYIFSACITLSQVPVGQTDRVRFVLEPPQMLKGDFMVRRLSVSYTHTHTHTHTDCTNLTKLHTVSSTFLLSLQIACYHKNDSLRTHETVFSVQFHTGTLCGDQLSLQKEDLDHANKGTLRVFGQIFALSVPKVFEDKNLRYFHFQNNNVSRTNSFIFSDKSIDILFVMLT